jgi:hypothetical protein
MVLECSLQQSQLLTTCPYHSQLDPVHTPTSHFLKIRLVTDLIGPGSSVGIATGCGLDGPGIESWW